MAKLVFCICGATLEKRDLPPDMVVLADAAHWWVGSDGDIYCYPDSTNEVDRWARHEPEGF